jgi:hypothetical protein
MTTNTKKEFQPETKKNYCCALALKQLMDVFNQYLGIIAFLTLHPSCNRYVIKHPGVTPNNIKVSKDFMSCVALRIVGIYDDPDAYLSSVVQTYKNFTTGWQ